MNDVYVKIISPFLEQLYHHDHRKVVTYNVVVKAKLNAVYTFLQAGGRIYKYLPQDVS